MQLTRRAALVGAGGLAAAAGLTACSGGGSPTPDSSAPLTTGAPAPTAVPSARPVPPSGGPGRETVVIVGHRGASGYRPEHTEAAYALAARMGADAVDVDLCATGDGALVARHEPEIGETTDVGSRPEFADRRRTGVVIDGTSYDGWFTTDFTLAELKTLRAIERIPATRPHNRLYDRREPILTLDEVMDVLDALSAELGRAVGILPEVKHSTWHGSVGLAVEPALVEILRRRGRDRPESGVIIQSFEVANLQALREQVGCPLLQLVDSAGAAPADFVAAGDVRTFDDLITPGGLREIAAYAAWIGPSKERVVGDDGPTPLVAAARSVGLRTMPYTFRNENEFLPAALQRGETPGQAPDAAPASTYGDAFAEYAQYRALGIEGLFSDHPDTAIAAYT